MKKPAFVWNRKWNPWFQYHMAIFIKFTDSGLVEWKRMQKNPQDGSDKMPSILILKLKLHSPMTFKCLDYFEINISD